MAVKTQAQLLAQVASLLADNTTGDISALDVRTCLNDIIDSASYGGSKVYKALLTQTGTSAPVATVLVNTLSGTPVWSRDSDGSYKLTLASEFTIGKTYFPQPPNTGSGGSGKEFVAEANYSANEVYLSAYNGGVLTDVFTYLAIEIEVYP